MQSPHKVGAARTPGSLEQRGEATGESGEKAYKQFQVQQTIDALGGRFSTRVQDVMERPQAPGSPRTPALPGAAPASRFAAREGSETQRGTERTEAQLSPENRGNPDETGEKPEKSEERFSASDRYSAAPASAPAAPGAVHETKKQKIKDALKAVGIVGGLSWALSKGWSPKFPAVLDHEVTRWAASGIGSVSSFIGKVLTQTSESIGLNTLLPAIPKWIGENITWLGIGPKIETFIEPLMVSPSLGPTLLAIPALFGLGKLRNYLLGKPQRGFWGSTVDGLKIPIDLLWRPARWLKNKIFGDKETHQPNIFGRLKAGAGKAWDFTKKTLHTVTTPLRAIGEFLNTEGGKKILGATTILGGLMWLTGALPAIGLTMLTPIVYRQIYNVIKQTKEGGGAAAHGSAGGDAHGNGH